MTAELRAVRTIQALEDASALTGSLWNLQNTIVALRQLRDMCAPCPPKLCSQQC